MKHKIQKGKEYVVKIPMGDLANRGSYLMDELKIDVFKMSSVLQGLTGIDKDIWATKLIEMRQKKLKKVI